MKLTNKITTLATAAGLALAAGTASAAISFTFAGPITERDGSQTLALAGDSSDMIVVMVSGEHGFNNTSGQANGVTYNGIAMTEVVDRDPLVNGSDIEFASMFILAGGDIAAGDGSGVVTDVVNRGAVSAYAVTGVSGVVQSGFGAAGDVSTTINTAAGNLVIAGLALGGDGNTGNINSVVGSGDLALDGAADDPSNWYGHAAGSDVVDTTGSNTYGFSGAGGAANIIIWAELQAIPEPSTTALLGLGGLALIFRRRK